MFLLGIFILFCLAILAEMIRVAPLVDDHEQLIRDEDMPREVPISRTEFMQ